MDNLSYLMGHILYQMFKTILSTLTKKHQKVPVNPPIKIYVKEIDDRIAFKINTGCYFELLRSELMKLLGSTKNKVTVDENVENVAHLEITKVILVHCNLVNNNYQRNSRVLYAFIKIHVIFLKTLEKRMAY